MGCKPILLCLALFPILAHGADSSPKDETQWLSWPVTGYPFNLPGGAALLPPPKERFLTGVRRDVIIGLRSDGTVVWRHVPISEPPSMPAKGGPRMELVPIDVQVVIPANADPQWELTR